MNNRVSAAPTVIKIGGHEIADASFLVELAQVVRNLEGPIIIVHGGGKEISALQQKLGIEPRYVDGIRITDAASLSIVEMVLCGTVNKRLVRYLILGGVEAIGLSGVDRGMIRALPMHLDGYDMGYTGEVASVREDVLQDLLADGIVPVIAPICLGDDNDYNVNADHVAGAVAAAVQAERVIFLTNVEGVLVDGQVSRRLSDTDVDRLIEAGTIYGGMIPKVSTALEALERGIPSAVITNLAGLATHGGTVLVRAELFNLDEELN